jgi:hypothetical protein
MADTTGLTVALQQALQQPYGGWDKAGEPRDDCSDGKGSKASSRLKNRHYRRLRDTLIRKRSEVQVLSGLPRPTQVTAIITFQSAAYSAA